MINSQYMVLAKLRSISQPSKGTNIHSKSAYKVNDTLSSLLQS